MSKNTRRLSILAIAVIGAVAAGQAGASGFQLREQNVKNIGKAYAGSAVATDGSSVFNNPAAMVNANGNLFQANVAGIDLTATFTGAGKYATGLPISGGNGGDPGSLTAVPAMSAIFKMKGALEGLTLGLGVDAPYGLKTDYEKGWIGRYQATVSSVKTVDLTMSAAFQISPMVSAGVGLVYERLEVTLGKDIPFGTILASVNPALINTPDGNITIKGKNNAVGFIAGFQIKPTDSFTLGYAHRSAIRHHIDGTADFTTPAAFQGLQPGFQALSGNTALSPTQRAQLAALGYGFVDSRGASSVSTPSTDTLSADWKVADRVHLYGEFQRTGWSSLKSVDITFSNPYQAPSSEKFNWKDSNFVSVGADFKLNDSFTLRGGVGFDKTPTNDHDRTPRLPDNDRTLYSVGATWNASQALSVDAGYTRVEIKSPTVNLPVDTTGGRYNSLQGSFKGHADVFGVAATYKF